jgi:hypothetical protein
MRMTDAELISEVFVGILAKTPMPAAEGEPIHGDSFFVEPEFGTDADLVDCNDWRAAFMDVLRRRLGEMTPYQMQLVEALFERFAPLSVETTISPFRYTLS